MTEPVGNIAAEPGPHHSTLPVWLVDAFDTGKHGTGNGAAVVLLKDGLGDAGVL